MVGPRLVCPPARVCYASATIVANHIVQVGDVQPASSKSSSAMTGLSGDGACSRECAFSKKLDRRL